MVRQFDLDTVGEHLPNQTEQINPQLHRLFHQILENVIENPEFQSAIPDLATADDVMMEVRVNGVHYTVYHSTSLAGPSHINLSPREREIVRLVAKGLPTKLIASTLEVSPWTICTHLRRIFSKLGVKSRAEMVAHALEDNLLEGK